MLGCLLNDPTTTYNSQHYYLNILLIRENITSTLEYDWNHIYDDRNFIK